MFVHNYNASESEKKRTDTVPPPPAEKITKLIRQTFFR